MKVIRDIPIVGALVVFIGVMCSNGYNPYSPGTYSTDSLEFLPTPDGIPLHSIVFYPLSPGQYTPIFFIGGLYGWVTSMFYTTLLTNLASHGYIAIGIDRFYPGQSGQVPSLLKRQASWNVEEVKAIQLYFNTTQWIKSNLTNQIVAKADWSRTALLCHSAGCDDTLVMINISRSFAQASVFIDPMSLNALTLQPISSHVKILAYMTQLSEEKPECCIPGTDYKKIYDLLTCTKVRMQVKDFGHCDILDDLLWEACHIIHTCRTTNNSRISEYKNFTTGVIDGFLQWTLYGNSDMQKYVINQSYLPLQLVDLAYNGTC
ncbi:hypothetical protein Btru_067257 [Bulinus truncatus]|nr:hypothetical protein Btru_067257 [Bulinus truncatus]